MATERFDVWINVHDGYFIPGGHVPHISEDVARRERCEHPGCKPTHYVPESWLEEAKGAALERIVSLEAQLSAMAAENVTLAAKLRLVGMGADAALAAIDAHPAVEVVAQTPQPLRPREG